MGAGLRRPRVAWLDTRSRHALVLRDAKWIAHPFVWRAHGGESALLLAGRRAGHQPVGGRAKRRRRRATRRARPRRLRSRLPRRPCGGIRVRRRSRVLSPDVLEPAASATARLW